MSLLKELNRLLDEQGTYLDGINNKSATEIWHEVNILLFLLGSQIPREQIKNAVLDVKYVKKAFASRKRAEKEELEIVTKRWEAFKENYESLISTMFP
jgi:hypothetical protein